MNKKIALLAVFLSPILLADQIVLQCGPTEAGSPVGKVAVALDGNELQASVEATIGGARQTLTYDVKVGPRRHGGTGLPVGYTGHFFSLLLDSWNGPRTGAQLEATVPLRNDAQPEVLKARLTCEWR